MTKVILMVAAIFAFNAAAAQQKKLTQKEKWEQKVAAYERRDAAGFPGKGIVVFTGSSSVENWKTLQQDFPDKKVLNRGISGTKTTDLGQYIARVVTPYKPRQIFLYIGDNDIGYKHSPDTILKDFKQLFFAIRKDNKKAEIVFMAIKPSPVRMKYLDNIEQTNGLIRDFLATEQQTGYADTFHPLLTGDKQIVPEYYSNDGLHMTAEGYKVWADVIRPLIK